MSRPSPERLLGDSYSEFKREREREIWRERAGERERERETQTERAGKIDHRGRCEQIYVS